MASPRPSSSTVRRKALALAIASACLLPAGAATAAPEAATSAYVSPLDAPVSPVNAGGEQRLLLEVFLGERSTGRLADLRLRGSRLLGSAEELAEVGVLVPEGVAVGADGLVAFDDLPGLSYRYDIANQSLHLQVPAALRPNQQLGYVAPTAVQASRDAGWTLDYDAYARQEDRIQTLAVTTAFTAFGRWGNFELSGITRAGDTEAGQERDDFERLDTRWSYSDPDRMWTWTAGDLISGGLSWTRPVRLGGLQWRRNFGVRPDLVTMPLPQYSADATLPSAVELYVNNVRQMGGDVDDGPFVLDMLPQISGAGEAIVVVRDSTGRTTQTSVPLYVDYQRLAPGLSDFSIEFGLPRTRFGGLRDDYEDKPVGSASWRRGMTNALTVEAHAEGGEGLQVGGAGLNWSPGARWGLISLAYARSDGDSSGEQTSIGYQWNAPEWGFDMQSQRRSEGYRDLGDLSADPLLGPTSLRSEDRATVWAGIPGGNLAFTWLRWRERGGDVRLTRTLSWSQLVGRNVYVSASVFDDGNHRGGALSLSLPLGPSRHATATTQYDGRRTETTASLREMAPYEGGWGWGVQAGDRDGGQGQLLAEYRGDHFEALFGVDHDSLGTGGFAQANGSIVSMGSQVFAARRIYDSFAIVSTDGVAGVPILSENRVLGHSNDKGYLLVPDLRGWQRNRVAIDPDRLPANYRVGEIERQVTPTDHGGVRVEFDVTELRPAIAVLHDRDGKPVPAGTRLSFGENGVAVVGFDGETYLESLGAGTVITAKLGGRTCRFTLPAAPMTEDGTPARLGPFRCEETSR